jgi:hypothetical protein
MSQAQLAVNVTKCCSPKSMSGIKIMYKDIDGMDTWGQRYKRVPSYRQRSQQDHTEHGRAKLWLSIGQTEVEVSQSSFPLSTVTNECPLVTHSAHMSNPAVFRVRDRAAFHPRPPSIILSRFSDEVVHFCSKMSFDKW